jgi:TAG lipase/steryl ester hydrolase/phospholipase A2/LPA acyltransferase
MYCFDGSHLRLSFHIYILHFRTATIVMENLPILREIGSEVVELIFVPKTIAKQLLLLVALETGMVTMTQFSSLLSYVLSNFSSQSRLIGQLQSHQQQAQTQDDWMDMAEKIDQIQGNDIWRTDPACPLYERDRITARIDEYVHLMRRRDIFELVFVLRGSIGRNKFGLLHEGLFSKALAGTKVLVETYHNVVCAALDFVCDATVAPNEDPIPTDARLAFFNETRHSYGRTALLLSGGAALGFYHVGVVRALMENRLLPRVIGGASAGSIVCSMIGTRTDEECLRDLFEVKGTDAPGHSGRLAFNFFRPIEEKQSPAAATGTDDATRSASGRGGFWEVYGNTAGAFHDAKLTLQGFVPIPFRRFSSFLYNVLTGNRRPQDLFMSDTEHFRNCVRDNVGNFTFQEAFDRTGRILNIVVTPKNSSDPPRLLNYLTAPHVLVWSAAAASSSLPGVFEANRLVVKEADGWERYESGGEDQAFRDGSMEQDLPMQQLSEMFNVNHFIISQANPHAVMFASYNQKQSVWTSSLSAVVSSLMTFLKDQVRSWLANLVACLGARRIGPFFETQRDMPMQFFTQEYEGRPTDISLVPWLSHRGLWSALLHVIYNPSEAEFREWIQAAERETWKFIPAIKSHIAEEMTLDRCVQRLRRRLVQESWNKHTGAGEHEKIESRVPSFFTSPSLTNLGGLNIIDQPTIEGLRVEKTSSIRSKEDFVRPVVIPNVDVNSGWGGLGLKGNRSSGNLQRTSSDTSGLFIDEEEQQLQLQQLQLSGRSQPPMQATGESTDTDTMLPKTGLGSSSDTHQGYFKTTSMANFYYRKSHGSTEHLAPVKKTSSFPEVSVSDSQSPDDGRKSKSKSTADLARSLKT